MFEDLDMKRDASTTTSPGVNPPRFPVQSVARALDIVEVVADSGSSGATLSELGRALRLSKSTVLATVRTLVGFGYLRSVEPGPRYKLGMNLVRLGDEAARRLPLTEVCAGLLRELAEATGLTVRLALADNGYPVFVDRVDGPGTIRFHTPLGGRELPHTTAAGKAILATLPPQRVDEICAETGLLQRTPNTLTSREALYAELERVRRDGYAVDDEEDAEGVICVGAVVRDHGGACAGAISMTGVKFDPAPERFSMLGEMVKKYAARASEVLSGRREKNSPA